VFQVHGIDAEGNVLIRRQLKRRYVLTFFEKLQPCLVGIEACAALAVAPSGCGRFSRPGSPLATGVGVEPPFDGSLDLFD
jgi:hypothetical protein